MAALKAHGGKEESQLQDKERGPATRDDDLQDSTYTCTALKRPATDDDLQDSTYMAKKRPAADDDIETGEGISTAIGQLELEKQSLENQLEEAAASYRKREEELHRKIEELTSINTKLEERIEEIMKSSLEKKDISLAASQAQVELLSNEGKNKIETGEGISTAIGQLELEKQSLENQLEEAAASYRKREEELHRKIEELTSINTKLEERIEEIMKSSLEKKDISLAASQAQVELLSNEEKNKVNVMAQDSTEAEYVDDFIQWYFSTPEGDQFFEVWDGDPDSVS